jgi:hypothetical protein
MVVQGIFQLPNLYMISTIHLHWLLRRMGVLLFSPGRHVIRLY